MSLLKKHRMAVCIILVALAGVTAVLAVSEIKTHLQFLELETKYKELVNVENWPSTMVLKLNGEELDPDSVQQVKTAISQLKLEGKFETQNYYDSTFTGSSMLPSQSILIYDSKGTDVWHLEVFENDSYCYETRARFSLMNSAPLYEVLEKLSSSAPVN